MYAAVSLIKFIKSVVYTDANGRSDIGTFFDNGINNSLYRIYTVSVSDAGRVTASLYSSRFGILV